MADKQKDIKSMIELIISNIDEFGYEFVTYKADSMKQLLQNTLEYINNKEQEREELQERIASIIYSLTGGRLSYSTYTLEGCEQAYHDQLEIDVEKATKELEEKLQAKEQECEELKEDVERWKSNFNGKVSAIEELLHQLDQLKAENEELRRSITKIFACLIKANRTNKIVDTIWVDNITTLWDYIALTLGIEGDQTQIEKQILQKIS